MPQRNDNVSLLSLLSPATPLDTSRETQTQSNQEPEQGQEKGQEKMPELEQELERPRTTTTSQPQGCWSCGPTVERAWRCIQCADSFCDKCWDEERPHKRGKLGIDGLPHEKVDEAVFTRLEQIFHQPKQEEQERRHKSDVNTTWFGIDKKGNEPLLYGSDRLADLLNESQVQHAERFPRLVSFVGQTGAGKSTLIKMLMNREKQNANVPVDDHYNPVPGLVGDNLPTTGDVHLYADPRTYCGQKPILYGDSEGMTGGENTPRGLGVHSHPHAENKWKRRMNVRKIFVKAIKWPKNTHKSREFAVRTLFPRILYTFSDVVVFVLREVRTFESEVLQLLVKWASTSIDKSINQPCRPHLIIVLNATEPNIDEGQWDPKNATFQLLDDYEKSVEQIPDLQSAIEALRQTEKPVKTTRDLLDYYYSSVTVLRIPSKGRYMKLDEQVGKLYGLIAEKCESSYDFRKSARMLLNTERLPIYVNAAYEHFSQQLNEPFDFLAEARLHMPPPKDLGGHLLNLTLLTYDQFKQNSTSIERLSDKLARPIASCIMLAATRNNTQGRFLDLLQGDYQDPLRDAISEFSGNWMRCSYQKDGMYCENVRNAHEKGHQSKDGKILSRGPFKPPGNEDDIFPEWMDKISQCMKHLEEELRNAPDEEEKSYIPKKHLILMKKFYQEILPTTRFQNHLSCAFCMGKIPEVRLPCGHMICKQCVQAFGESLGQGEFEMHSCSLHQQTFRWPEPERIKFKPKYAGVRVLCLDGGGVRGIVELAILQAIEKALGGHIPIQNFFDLIVGTSAGGIIALGLGIKNWSVSECITHFKSFCQKAFTPRRLRVLKPLRIISGRSVYKTKTLEQALQSAFDPTSVLYGESKPKAPTSIRVAVMSTLATQDRPAVLSNYNTEGRHGSLPYAFVRPRNSDHELKVWEAARATSAAPPYFKPFVHRMSSNSYMDGAIHYNCPAAVADAERKFLWSDETENWPPDILLSIGSGVGIADKEDTTSKPTSLNEPDQVSIESSEPRKPLHGISYFYRIANKMIQRQMDCEEIWRQYCKGTRWASEGEEGEEDRRAIRINIKFEERLSLDSIDSIDHLEKHAKDMLQQNPLVHQVAERLIASCFYFEPVALQKVPFRDRETGTYHRKGNIRCRFNEGTNDLRGLGLVLRRYVTKSFQPFFLVIKDYDSDKETEQKVEIPIATIDAMEFHRRFGLPTEVHVSSAEQINKTHIILCLYPENSPHNIRENISGDFSRMQPPISGFPRPLCDQNYHRTPPEVVYEEAIQQRINSEVISSNLELQSKDFDTGRETPKQRKSLSGSRRGKDSVSSASVSSGTTLLEV